MDVVTSWSFIRWYPFIYVSYPLLISLLRGIGLLLGLSDSILEVVLTSSQNFLHTSHTSSTGCSSSLGFGTPVETSVASTRVSTSSARMFLNVVGTTTTSHTQCMRFVVFLTKRCCSFRHGGGGGSAVVLTPLLP